MDEAMVYLAGLFEYSPRDDALRLEVRCLPPAWDEETDPPWPRRWYVLDGPYLTNAARSAKRWSDEGWEVYVGVLPRLGRYGGARAIDRADWLWCDLDAQGRHPDAIMAHLRGAPVPAPHMVVSSGGGFHCYWCLKQTAHLDTRENKLVFTGVLQRLADLLQGDRNACDVARILRLPGTSNHKLKEQARPVKLVDACFCGERLSLSGWKGILPAALPKKRVGPVSRRAPTTLAGFITPGLRSWARTAFPEGTRHNGIRGAATWLIKDKGMDKEDVLALLLQKAACSYGKDMIEPEEVRDIVEWAEKKWR